MGIRYASDGDIITDVAREEFGVLTPTQLQVTVNFRRETRSAMLRSVTTPDDARPRSSREHLSSYLHFEAFTPLRIVAGIRPLLKLSTCLSIVETLY